MASAQTGPLDTSSIPINRRTTPSALIKLGRPLAPRNVGPEDTPSLAYLLGIGISGACVYKQPCIGITGPLPLTPAA